MAPLVPFLDLNSAFSELAPLVTPRVESVLARGQYILGPECTAFEQEFATFVGAADCVGVGNGLDAGGSCRARTSELRQRIGSRSPGSDGSVSPGRWIGVRSGVSRPATNQVAVSSASAIATLSASQPRRTFQGCSLPADKGLSRVLDPMREHVLG